MTKKTEQYFQIIDLFMMRIFEEVPNILSSNGSIHPDYVYSPSTQRTFDRCPICGCKGLPYFNSFFYMVSGF